MMSEQVVQVHYEGDEGEYAGYRVLSRIDSSLVIKANNGRTSSLCQSCNISTLWLVW